MKLYEMKEFLVEILSTRTDGYGSLPIPSKLDNEMADFIDSFLELDYTKLDEVRREIIEEHKFIFLAFAERMACLAVRKKSEKEIYRGLGAIFFQAGLGDSREDIVIYTLLYDAVLKIGVDPDSLFLKAAKDFNYSEVSEIHKFLNRSDEIKRQR